MGAVLYSTNVGRRAVCLLRWVQMSFSTNFAAPTSDACGVWWVAQCWVDSTDVALGPPSVTAALTTDTAVLTAGYFFWCSCSVSWKAHLWWLLLSRIRTSGCSCGQLRLAALTVLATALTVGAAGLAVGTAALTAGFAESCICWLAATVTMVTVVAG